MRIKDIPW